ncbi:hypothetical protein HK096_006291 [Nowakowskiella sp. JEL0078]|nr:hypothetical protein HK096_006291 [Nowakowskiella sp. JEL0078]
MAKSIEPSNWDDFETWDAEPVHPQLTQPLTDSMSTTTQPTGGPSTKSTAPLGILSACLPSSTLPVIPTSSTEVTSSVASVFTASTSAVSSALTYTSAGARRLSGLVPGSVYSMGRSVWRRFSVTSTEEVEEEVDVRSSVDYEGDGVVRGGIARESVRRRVSGGPSVVEE